MTAPANTLKTADARIAAVEMRHDAHVCRRVITNLNATLVSEPDSTGAGYIRATIDKLDEKAGALSRVAEFLEACK